ncbi:MAG TPA: S8 family serine peptidase, partial [Burkholderiaceae bacterium]|nr:S8 family serine peptidase [Burkholderiaceae bacterium]
SIWGQGASQGSALKAQERSAWLHRLMDQLHQDQTLALSDEAEIARSLYLRPGNEAIGPEAVRAGILAIAAHHPHDPEQAAREVLRGALVNGLSAQQIADTGVLTHAQIDRYVQSLLTFFTLDEWTAVRNETIVAAVRPQLDAMGLNGAGVGVRVLEVENSGFHPQTVMAIINQARHGIAPGTAVELDTMYSESYPQQSIGEMLRNAVDNSGLSRERPEAWMVGLRNTLVNAVSGSLNDAAREIREFVYQSGARVMNMSFGSSLTSYYNLVDRMLIFYPKLHNGFFAGVQGEMSESQRMQRIVNFVNDTVLGSDRVMQSYDNYVYATSEAAQSGKTIVVAAGNWQNSTQRIRDQGVGMPLWAAMNVMALSPHVIAVGASSTNGTPHDLMDDTIASFSSNGDEQFPVTLATQGVQAAVSYALFASLDGEVNGTSFAAPLAAGVVALMLQRNPSLSFSQIKSILQAVAVDTPVPRQAEGAGMLDVMAAVLAESA